VYQRRVARLDNRTYYDDFAGWYERERGRGYHQMLDDLEVELALRHGGGGRVLEVGCGTGLILERIAARASRAVGLDLSRGMLEVARGRGLEVVQGVATALPFPDESFDCVCSFKVLPHVEDIETAMAEMSRVTAPGGAVLAEFYNRRSLRYLVKALKPPTAISENHHDEAVFTRYDSAEDIRSYLPPELEIVGWRGVRIVTPVAQAHKLPAIGQLLRWTEHRLADLPVARGLGGFLIAVLRKR
jgi:ubiquinone/menaquinone biosynthesis C-methylase UbiE